MKKIIITQETYPDDPRSWDNMTKIICFHNRYNLGDTFNKYNSSAFDSWQELSEQLHKDYNIAAILPIYMLDHSGITISTGSFDCKWDSGQIGFIFITKETIIENFGGKNLTLKMQQKAVEICESDIEIYNQYLNNDVYRFRIIDEVEYLKVPLANFDDKGIMILDPSNYETIIEDNEIASCGGFYGDNWFENGMSDHIPEELHELLKTTEITYEN